MKYGVLIFNDERAYSYDLHSSPEIAYTKACKKETDVKEVHIVKFTNNSKARSFKDNFNNGKQFTDEQKVLYDQRELYWQTGDVIPEVVKENKTDNSNTQITIVNVTTSGQTIDEISRIIKKCYMLSEDARSRLIGANNEENKEESNGYKVTYIDLKNFGGNR